MSFRFCVWYPWPGRCSWALLHLNIDHITAICNKRNNYAYLVYLPSVSCNRAVSPWCILNHALVLPSITLHGFWATCIQIWSSKLVLAFITLQICVNNEETTLLKLIQTLHTAKKNSTWHYGEKNLNTWTISKKTLWKCNLKFPDQLRTLFWIK